MRVSALCLGTAFFGVTPRESEAAGLVLRALDLGINFIDTANSYGNQQRFDRPDVPPWTERASSEELVGRALGRRRHGVIVATKVQEQMGEGPNDGGPDGGGLTRRHIMQQVEQSLRRLETDYIDVYYAHHPDPTTPLDQTLRALDDLIRQGKVRYAGLSNYPAWQLVEALWMCARLGLGPPVAMEMRYNLLDREIETDVVQSCLRFQVGIAAYSPLGRGVLSGKYRAGQPPPPGSWAFYHRPHEQPFPEPQLRLAERLIALAPQWGEAPPRLALAWLLSRPGVTSAIIGPSNLTQLEELVPAAGLQLSEEQLAALDALQLDA